MDGKVEPIAVIGMACKFPGADNLREFWENVQSGADQGYWLAKSEDEDFKAKKNFDDPDYVGKCSIINDIDLFDARYFKISSREADLLDPQYRIFLLQSKLALENASVSPSKYKGDIGVFASKFVDTYVQASYESGSNTRPGNLTEYIQSFDVRFGNEPDYLATFVSHKLDLTGPSITLYSACSSSLVAINMACNSLRLEECDIAIAGGVSIAIPQDIGYIARKGQFFSRSGQSRPFSDSADGAMFGNGCGVVVLKKLSLAIADRDNIHAVVLGGAVNNDGARKVGFTAPSYQGHKNVIEKSLKYTDVLVDEVRYIEAHGTGTYIGDPIEFSALAAVYGGKNRTTKTAIGSVKSTIGHLRNAAGVAGFIQLALILKYGKVPQNPFSENANKVLSIENSSLYLAEKDVSIRTQEKRVVGAVSSLGVGGTNAHMLLSDYTPEKDENPKELNGDDIVNIQISAKTESSLKESIRNFIKFLQVTTTPVLADIAYTLSCGRCDHSYRFCMSVTNIESLTTKLYQGLDNSFSKTKPTTAKLIIFSISSLNRKTLFENINQMKSVELFSSYFRDITNEIYGGLAPQKFHAPIEQDCFSEIELGIMQKTYNHAYYQTICAMGLPSDFIVTDSSGDLEYLLSRPLLLKHCLNICEESLEKIAKSSIIVWNTKEKKCADEYYDISLEASYNRLFRQGGDQVVLISNAVYSFFSSELQQNGEDSIADIISPYPFNTKSDFRFHKMLSKLWCDGYSIDWNNYWKLKTANKCELPIDAMEMKRHWFN